MVSQSLTQKSLACYTEDKDSTIDICVIDAVNVEQRSSRNPLYRSRLIFSLWFPDSPVNGLNKLAGDYVIFVRMKIISFQLLTRENTIDDCILCHFYVFTVTEHVLQSLTPSF